MRNELAALSDIKYGLKGYLSMQFLDITYDISKKSEQLLKAYSMVAEQLEFSEYSYIMILPWLISGGIDLFAINYLNEIASIMPKQHILVLLTNGTHKSFSKKELNLADNISLVELPDLLKGHEELLELLPELVYSLINIFKPSRLHIMASKIGYDCIIKHGEQIRKNNIKIIFSSYNYLMGVHGEYIGYTVQELPLAFRQGDVITTDNQVSKQLWVNHFGFNADDILVHYQLFEINQQKIPAVSTKDGINILWAAHIRPEKNPNILPAIADALKKDKVHIDCYGLFNAMHWPDGQNPIDTNSPNLHYMGPYSNFFNDIDLAKYDLFLYTSHADGTPNVVIEAALAGLPIVASSIGGIPEALGDDVTLVKDTFSPEEFIEAIHTTLSDIGASRLKAKNLQKRLSAKHSKDNFTAQVKEMLERSKQ